jgi:cytidine deaminase
MQTKAYGTPLREARPSLPGDQEALLDAARQAREMARAPFSRFQVGAAVLDEAGRIFTGCNIENSSFGLTICAERVALFKAVSEGSARIIRVAVVADTAKLTPPCGACRQVLWELAPGAELLLANLQGNEERLQMSEIFPRAFDASFL